MKTITPRSVCPISFSLDFLGDKWTLLILRDLFFFGKSSFSEFLDSDEKIASNILSSRLESLEAYGFVIKNVSPKNKSKFIYTMTEKGIDVIPVIVALSGWGIKYNPDNDKSCPLQKELRKSKSLGLKKYNELARENRQSYPEK